METTRALRIIQALAERLENVRIGEDQTPFAAIYLGRETLYGDGLDYPCASVLETNEDPIEQQVDNARSEQTITVVGVTVSDPDQPLIAGHALCLAMMRALFPNTETLCYGRDRLNSLARRLTYFGREIYPREDGGRTTAVMITLRVEYALRITDPAY